MVMKGYFEMPEETAVTFTEDGYLKTGDQGYLDSENYLYLTGRATNMIVTEGGKNVYPEEIENEFQLFEAVEQVLVRGFIADKEMKIEDIEALIYPNPELKNETGQPFSKPELKAKIDGIVSEVNLRLQPYQRINRITILDQPMEMTTTKKIKRGTV
jgi:long-chain acyl-CoA synthetase